MHRPIHRNPQLWLEQMFAVRATEMGGVIRRQVVDVEREVGFRALEAEVRRRGFRLIRSRNYYIVVCDGAPLDLIC